MKKKIFLSAIIILFIFFLTGCGKNNDNNKFVNTKEDVINYLSEKYPDDNFDSIEYEGETNALYSGCKKNNSWTVRSTETNVTFKVYGTDYYGAYYCTYDIDDSYFTSYTSQFLEVNNYTKTHNVSYNIIEIYIEDFNNLDEVAKYVLDLSNSLKNDTKFNSLKEKNTESFNININKDYLYVTSFKIEEINNITTIKNTIENAMNNNS